MTLLNAYQRVLNLKHNIPTDIKSQIIKFCGPSMFSSKSFIATKTFNASCIPSNVAQDELNIGKTIEISFDESNPNLYNIPTMLRTASYKKYKQNVCAFTVILGICCVIIYIVIIVLYQHRAGIYYLMYSVYLCLVVHFVNWYRSRYDPVENREKDYGTFRNKIRESENLRYTSKHQR